MLNYATSMPTAKTNRRSASSVLKKITRVAKPQKQVAETTEMYNPVRSVIASSVAPPPIPERTQSPIQVYPTETPRRGVWAGWRCKLLALAIFLFPFVVLPWTFSVHEFSKQLFLTLIVGVGLVIVLATSKGKALGLIPRHIVIPLWILTLLVAVAGAVRSGAWAQSLIGYNGTESFSALTFLLLGLWMTLVYHGGRDNFKLPYAALTASGSILSLITILSLFGFNLYRFAGGIGFNPAGTTTTAGIIAAATILLALGGLLEATQKNSRLFFIVAVIPPLFLIVGIGLQTVWIALAVGLLAYLPHAHRRTLLPRGTVIPLALGLLLTIVFAIRPLISFLPTPLEVGPSHAETWRIAQSALAESPWIGSGPGTFAAAYLRFRSLPILQTPFWNISFDWGSSAGLTSLVTAGWIGTALLILTGLAVLGWYTWKLHREETSTQDWAIMGAGTLLFVAAFLTPIPLAASFFFTTLLGLMLARLNTQSLKINRRIFGVPVILFILIIMLVQGRRTIAETIALKNQIQTASDIAPAKTRLSMASRIDPWNDNIMRMHTDLERLLLQQKLQESNPVEPQKALQEIRDLADNALTTAKGAVRLAPGNVANWNTLGGVYLDIAPFTSGAAQEAIKAFSKARELSPSDPTILVNLGIAQSLYSQTEKEGTANTISESAEEALRKATQLRPSLTLAHLELARLLGRGNKIDEALAAYRNVATLAPNDPALHYETGLFLLQNKREKEAETELLAAIKLAPNFSNARWYLAQAYEAGENLTAAIEQIQKVIELNPDNEQAKTRLEELQKQVE